MRHGWRYAAPLFVGVIGIGLLGCAESERSTEAYCASVVEQQDELAAKYNTRADELAESDDGLLVLLGAAATAFEAQGDLGVYFDKLERVAPPEIQEDVAAVRDAFKSLADRAADDATNPLELLAGSLVEGFQVQGSLDRVNTFTMDNCGRSI